jgi:hypothetical protein
LRVRVMRAIVRACRATIIIHAASNAHRAIIARARCALDESRTRPRWHATDLVKWRKNPPETCAHPIFLRECGKFATVLAPERPVTIVRTDFLASGPRFPHCIKRALRRAADGNGGALRD